LKSFIFTTDNDRGGVMLCDIDTLPDAVEYLNKRFPGVVKVEMGKEIWTFQEGFQALGSDLSAASLEPAP
jgi:hypothetical protein